MKTRTEKKSCLIIYDPNGNITERSEDRALIYERLAKMLFHYYAINKPYLTGIDTLFHYEDETQTITFEHDNGYRTVFDHVYMNILTWK